MRTDAQEMSSHVNFIATTNEEQGGFKIGVLFNSLDEPSFSAIRRFINRV
jgi:hypothetical protein